MENLWIYKIYRFFRYSKTYPWVVEILYYMKPLWKNTMWTVLLVREIRDNPKMTTSASFEYLFSNCMAMISWNRKLHKFSIFCSLTSSKDMPQNFKVLKWTTLQKLKACCSSQFSYMMLISMTENSLVNLLVEDFKNLKIASNSCAITIIFATLTASTRYSKFSNAALAKRFFQRKVI